VSGRVAEAKLFVSEIRACSTCLKLTTFICILHRWLPLCRFKRALMSDALRSTFLAAMKKGASAQGRGWMTEI